MGCPPQPPAEGPSQGLRFWGPAHWAGVPAPAPRSRSLLSRRLHGAPGAAGCATGRSRGRGGFGAFPFLLLFPLKCAPPLQSHPPECFALSPLSWMPLLRLAPRPCSRHLCYLPAGGAPAPHPLYAQRTLCPPKISGAPPGASSRAWTGTSRPQRPLPGVGVGRRVVLGGCQGDVRGGPRGGSGEILGGVQGVSGVGGWQALSLRCVR